MAPNLSGVAMNDAWGYNDDNAGQGEIPMDGPKALREAYAALKAQNEELKNGLASIRQDINQQRVATVFETLGAPQAAALYTGDPDPVKAKEWFTSMQAVFGGAQGQAPVVADSTPGLSPETQDQFQRMTQAGAEGVPMGNIDNANAAVGSATSIQDLINVYKNGTF